MRRKKIKRSDYNSSQEFFDDWRKNRSWWRNFSVEMKMYSDMIWYNLRSDEYRKDMWIFKRLTLLKLFGFKPIIIGTFFGEDTFIFETDEEATKAFEFFERGYTIPKEGIEERDDIPKYRGWLVGWWYGKEKFKEALKKAKEDYGEKAGNINCTDYSYFDDPMFVGVSFNFNKVWEKTNK